MTYTPFDSLIEAREREQDEGPTLALWPADTETWVRFGHAEVLHAWTAERVYTLTGGRAAFGDVHTTWESAPRNPPPDAERV